MEFVVTIFAHILITGHASDNFVLVLPFFFECRPLCIVEVLCPNIRAILAQWQWLFHFAYAQ